MGNDCFSLIRCLYSNIRIRLCCLSLGGISLQWS